MKLTDDLKSPWMIHLKGALFLILGLMAAAFVWLEIPTLRTLGLLCVTIWAFCRFYYYLFYVLERYLGNQRSSGIFDALKHLVNGRNSPAPESSTPPTPSMKLTHKTWISLVFLTFAGVVLCYGIKPKMDRLKAEARAEHLLRNGYQIHQALFAYASSHDQVFPSVGPDGADFKWSNDAFRTLFVGGQLSDESLFFAEGTPWCVGNKSDGVIGNSATHYADAVARGENFWAYVTGQAADRDDSTHPLIMDGYTAERLAGKADRRTKMDKDLQLIIRMNGSAKISPDNSEVALKKSLGEANVLPPQP